MRVVSFSDALDETPTHREMRRRLRVNACDYRPTSAQQ